MSVLTHDTGRTDVKTTTNVCGFDSETWQGGSTPWDVAMDWPTTPMSKGINEIKWNIAWGPHFLDTEEFRYWITKPDFVFDASKELDWSDFEDEPFCVLFYDDSNPTANSNVEALRDSTQFRTFCDVPERAGHQVIYAEWGRNEWTYERFHGCMDVEFGPQSPSSPPPPTQPTPETPQPTPAPASPPIAAPVAPPTAAPVAPTTAPISTVSCSVSIRGGRNPWYAGLDVGFDASSIVLDYTGTGLDLSTVNVDSGVFTTSVSGQKLTLTKPNWVSASTPGYTGFHGSNIGALATFSAPSCLSA